MKTPNIKIKYQKFPPCLRVFAPRASIWRRGPEDWARQLCLLPTICRTNSLGFGEKPFENMSLETSESLRQQFQLIQEQQQRKLVARKQRKAKNSEKTAQEDEGPTTDKLLWGHNGVSDNLDLKVGVVHHETHFHLLLPQF